MCKAQAVNGQKLAATVAATALLAGVCRCFQCCLSIAGAVVCVAAVAKDLARGEAAKNQAP